MLSKKVRVFELAGELNIPAKKVIAELNEEFGCDVKSHANSVLPTVAQKFRDKYQPAEAIAKKANKEMKEGKEYSNNWIYDIFAEEFGEKNVIVIERTNPDMFGLQILHNKKKDTYTFSKKLRPSMANIADVNKAIDIITRKDKKEKKEN